MDHSVESVNKLDHDFDYDKKCVEISQFWLIWDQMVFFCSAGREFVLNGPNEKRTFLGSLKEKTQ